MIALVAAFLLTSPKLVDHPRTYLASVIRLPMKGDDKLSAFAFETWGVRITAVCRVPGGWTVKAGGSAAPDGVLEGEGGQGITWMWDDHALKNIALVTLYGPVQQADRPNVGGVVPATFKGVATVQTDDVDDVKRPLTWRNIRLTPARRCPTR